MSSRWGNHRGDAPLCNRRWSFVASSIDMQGNRVTSDSDAVNTANGMSPRGWGTARRALWRPSKGVWRASSLIDGRPCDHEDSDWSIFDEGWTTPCAQGALKPGRGPNEPRCNRWSVEGWNGGTSSVGHKLASSILSKHCEVSSSHETRNSHLGPEASNFPDTKCHRKPSQIKKHDRWRVDPQIWLSL